MELGDPLGNKYDVKWKPFRSAKSLLNVGENGCLISSWRRLTGGVRVVLRPE